MKLNSAWLTTNRTCNNRCEWCYAKNTLSNTQLMDFEKAKEAVDELAKRKVNRIMLIGGEPTIYPNFIELIQYIREKEIQVSLATNGRKFKDLNFAKKVIQAGITGIDISLKAISEEEYLKNTNSYGLNEMIEGYKNLKKIGFNPSVSYVIIEDSKERFEEVVKFISSQGIDRFAIQFVKPVVEEKDDEILDLNKMGKFVEYIYEIMNSHKEISYSMEISFPLCLINRDILNELVEQGRIFNCCHVPRGTGIIFDQDFKVLPCNHFAEYPFCDDSIDFSDKLSIEKLWESETVKEFRKKAQCYPTEKCEECNLWVQCGGGCFTRWLYIDPNDYIK